MTYEKMNVPCVDENACSPHCVDPNANLSAMMDIADNLSRECLQMAYDINHHMFGNAQAGGEPTGKPLCFRDVLSIEIGTLNKLRGELAQIMKDIGI